MCFESFSPSDGLGYIPVRHTPEEWLTMSEDTSAVVAHSAAVCADLPVDPHWQRSLDTIITSWESQQRSATNLNKPKKKNPKVYPGVISTSKYYKDALIVFIDTGTIHKTPIMSDLRPDS